jgi:quercetin dioxygenase-like cupin family protein
MKLTHLSILAIVALSLNAAADEPKAAPPAVRTILEHHDQSGVPGKEIVIGTATLPPGSSIAYHTHPGDESGYVLKGTLILKVQGQPDRTLKAGDSFFNPKGAVHSVMPAPGADGAMAVDMDRG